jgi:sigma-B regulation protein RsbU (phosphoserine phosphatase)
MTRDDYMAESGATVANGRNGMYRIGCSEVWGGIKNEDLDACSAVMTISLYSSACDGGRGGDIYYLSVCQGDMLTRVALADVVGHGEKVADVSQWLYSSLRDRMNGGAGSDILADLNRLVVARGIDALTTAAVVSLHRPDLSLTFSYAGHHPMLMRQRDGKGQWDVKPLRSSQADVANLPLGVSLDTRYDQETLRVHSGDRVLLYTDGVTETPGGGRELFGEARLRAVLNEVGDESLAELKHAVLRELHEFSGGELVHDDVTLLAIEVN